MAKRIIIYTNHYFPEQFKINDLVSWLLEEDFEIRVITGLPNYPDGKTYKGYSLISNLLRKTNNKKLIVNRLMLIPRGNGSYLMIIVNYLSYFASCLLFTIYIAVFKKKYDIIFVHHTSPFLIALHPIIYSLFHNTKKIIWELDLWPDTLRDINLLKSKKLYSIIEKIVIKTYSFYDKILVGSFSFKAIISKRFNKEIIYFPNWADYEIENPIQSNIKFSIPNNHFKIMYTGNIGTVQNFDRLIETIETLKSKKIHWIFVGGGRYKSQFIKLINEKNLQNSTSFISKIEVKKIPSYVKHADCMYLSLKDSYIFKRTVPAKLQTYLSLAKPILGVISGEGATIINNANCGFVDENNNFNEFSKLVLKMSMLSDNEMKRMGENSKKYYDNNFKSSLLKNKLFNILQKI